MSSGEIKWYATDWAKLRRLLDDGFTVDAAMQLSRTQEPK